MKKLLLSVLLCLCFTIPTAAQDESAFHEILSYGRGVPQSVYWQPDGDQVLVNSITGVWLYSGDDLSDIAHFDVLRNAVFSPDGRWLVGADAEDQTQIRDAKTFDPITLPDDFQKPAFSPDGRWMLGTVGEKPVLFDATDFHQVDLPAEYIEQPPTYFIWSPDSQKLMAVGADNNISIWKLGDDTPAVHIEATLPGYPQWSPDSRKILRNDPTDNRVQIWDGDSGALLIDIPAQADQPFYREGERLNGYVAWAANNSRIIRYFPTADGIDMQVCDALTGDAITVLKTDQLWSVWFSPDGQRVVLDGGIYDFNRYEKISNLYIEYALLWSPDSRHIAVAYPRSVGIVDGVTGEESQQLNNSEDTFYFIFLTWSPDSSKLLTWNETDGLILWGIETGEIAAQIDQHIKTATYQAFNADGSRLATADSTGKVRLWNTQTGELVKTMQQLGEVDTLLWQPDGHLLATQNQYDPVRTFWDGKDDRNMVYIWDGETGELVHAIKGQTGLRSTVWRPDGTQLLVGNEGDNSVIVWDAATNTESTIDVQVGYGYVHYPQISWSPDLQILLLDYNIATHNGQGIRLIETSSGKVLADQIGYLDPNVYAWSADSQKLRLAALNCPPYSANGCTVRVRTIFDRANPPFDTVRDFSFDYPVDFVMGTFDNLPTMYWSPNGKWLAALSANVLQLWDVERHMRVSLARDVQSITWSPDGNWLAVVFNSGRAEVIGLTSDSAKLQFDDATGVKWSADGRLLTIYGQDHQEIRDVDTGTLVRTLSSSNVIWSRDGTKYIDLSGGMIRVWAR